MLTLSETSPSLITLFGLDPFIPIIFAETELFKLVLLPGCYILFSLETNKFEVLFLFIIMLSKFLFEFMFYLSLELIKLFI